MAHRAVSRAGQSVIDLGFAEILALSERCFCATLGVRFSIGTVRLQVRVRKQGGMTMFRKLTIALIATAALSIAVFARLPPRPGNTVAGTAAEVATEVGATGMATGG